MKKEQTGPALSDEEFFLHCLNLDDERMKEVRGPASDGNYGEARKALAAVIRNTLEPERFFAIPYETPENVFKLPGESDEAACERMKRHIMVSVGVPCDFGKEGKVDWTANPTYNKYKEWTWQLNRHNEIKMMAHEYRKNPNPSYARLAAGLLDGWMKQAGCPGHVSGYETECWRTIECGIRMGANWPYVLFTFYKTEAFSDDLLTDWCKSVWEHGDRLYHCRTRGNWLIMEMNGLAQTGIFYPWFKESSVWLSSAFSSLLEELDKQIYADGFQYELSTGYHDVVVNNYQRLIEAARAFDVPVPKDIINRLSKACEVSVKLMMPDGCLPDINDGRKFSLKEIFEAKARILPEEKSMRWILEDKPSWLAPSYKSVAMAWSGFLIMRDGWNKKNTWALFDGAPFGRGHQHEDKLNLLFYAQEKLLLTEGGNYAYDDSEMRKYVLSARAHNTVMADGKGQNRRKHYSWEDEDIKKKANLLYHIGETADFGESTYDEGYGEEEDREVTHNRRVYFIKNPERGLNPFMIVADRLSASSDHKFEALWHVDSPLRECFSGRGLVSFDELDVCVSEAVTSLQTVWGRKEPEWQGFIATGTEQGMYRPVSCVTAEAEGSHVRMVTVIYPHQKGEERIFRVAASKDPEESRILIELAGGETVDFDEMQLKTE